MKKRVLAALTAVSVIATMAGCNGNTSSTASTTAAPDAGTTAAPAGTDAPATDAPTDGSKQEILVYTFTDETEGMLNGFLEANPDFAAKYTFKYNLTGDANEYVTKVEKALGTNTDVPDLYLADADYARKFAENAGTASLDELGITVNPDDYYKYTLDFTTVDGKMMGISHQATPGAMFYRSDYAKEYLGIETPEDMQAAVSTWDGFLDVAGKIKNASAGAVTMCAGIDELKRNFLNGRESGWVVDGKLNIDETTVKKFLDTSKAMADADELNALAISQWQANWYAGMKESVFCYFGCTWYLHYTIKPNCLADAEAEQAVGNGSYGLWNMIAGPSGFFWGGTWWFGSDNAAASDKKDAVAQVIKYFCVDDATMEAYALKTGDFLSKKTVVEKIKDNEQFNNDFLGGQNHYQIFAQAADAIDISKNVTKYDATFNTAFDNLTSNYVVNGQSYDDAIATFKAEVASAIPDITVE